MYPTVNGLNNLEAAKPYASIGIIKHPLYGPVADVSSPGKQPKKNGWQKLKCPYRFQDEDTSIISEWRRA